MSRTELYIVKTTGELELFKEFGNSHRGASLLWHNLGERYLDGLKFYEKKEMEKLWRLDKDPRLSREEKILLISTFDHELIKRENLQQFIDACEKVSFEDNGHFKKYPEVMKEIMEIEDVIAIAWNQTSISSGVWDVYELCPTCEHDTLRRDYNILKDNDHQFLFDYLDGVDIDMEWYQNYVNNIPAKDFKKHFKFETKK